MRLTCPNCDAEYEVPDGMMPAAGRHVQCTSCHTRWFARGSAAAAPSEEQILTRLEARAPRPVAAGGGGEAQAAEPLEPGLVAPVVPLRRPVEPVDAAHPAKPAERPAVTRPGSVSATRPAPRLDLGSPPEAPPPAPPASRGRFGFGLVAAVLLFLLALGAYDFRREIAGQVPEAGPALDAYAETVDDLRDRIERQLALVRNRIDELAG
jgi:predicted Zn finger-like uncharacterized protein